MRPVFAVGCIVVSLALAAAAVVAKAWLYASIAKHVWGD